jgi:hypothetical protein
VAAVSPEVEIARQQWQAASRRIERFRADPPVYRRLMRQVDTLAAELRRRLGQTFTLAQLVQAYQGAEAWTFAVIEEKDTDRGWEREAALVADVAFHVYSRGASDYTP